MVMLSLTVIDWLFYHGGIAVTAFDIKWIAAMDLANILDALSSWIDAPSSTICQFPLLMSISCKSLVGGEGFKHRLFGKAIATVPFWYRPLFLSDNCEGRKSPSMFGINLCIKAHRSTGEGSTNVDGCGWCIFLSDRLNEGQGELKSGSRVSVLQLKVLSNAIRNFIIRTLACCMTFKSLQLSEFLWSSMSDTAKPVLVWLLFFLHLWTPCQRVLKARLSELVVWTVCDTLDCISISIACNVALMSVSRFETLMFPMSGSTLFIFFSRLQRPIAGQDNQFCLRVEFSLVYHHGCEVSPLT